MFSVQITVLRKADYTDLQTRYENPIEHACDLTEGQTFLSSDGTRPEGFCESAWTSVQPFAFALACGAEDFYGGWMKNKHAACISCNDGFRPVSFLLERLDGKEQK